MKKKIIVVDDKPTIAKIVAAYLPEYDFQYFENPLPCIESLENSTELPDLIISDIMMPKMSGDMFLDYLKKSEKLRSIPVVILSAEDSSSRRIHLLQNGAEDYLVKPFNPLELKIRISKILRK